MKERGTVVNYLEKVFDHAEANSLENDLFQLAELYSTDKSSLKANYLSIAKEKLGELLTPGSDVDTIVDDIRNGRRGYDSTAYTSVRKRYDSIMIEGVQKPKTVKGLHFCKEKNCGSDEFYIWTAQTRSADEGMTNFRQCAKCGKRKKS